MWERRVREEKSKEARERGNTEEACRFMCRIRGERKGGNARETIEGKDENV